MKMKEQIQICWIQGLYFKQAIESSVFISGLADKNIVRNMPKYPEKMPYTSNIESMSKEERLKEIERRMEKWVQINNKK